MFGLSQIFMYVAIGAVGVAGLQTWRLDMAKEEAAVQGVELQACGNRLQNLIDDVRRDNEIDNIPDGALTDAPSHWMLREGG